MTDQLDPFDRYQNKKKKFLRKILRRMFRVVGRTYSPKITSEPDWFLTSTWTEQQEKEFKEYFVRVARKDLRWPKRRAIIEAGWFVFFHGWKRSDFKVAAVNKPKIKPCHHKKHICRCKEFQPASGDNFCANCACPASYHSAAALRGKTYTGCTATKMNKRKRRRGAARL